MCRSSTRPRGNSKHFMNAGLTSFFSSIIPRRHGYQERCSCVVDSVQPHCEYCGPLENFQHSRWLLRGTVTIRWQSRQILHVLTEEEGRWFALESKIRRHQDPLCEVVGTDQAWSIVSNGQHSLTLYYTLHDVPLVLFQAGAIIAQFASEPQRWKSSSTRR